MEKQPFNELDTVVLTVDIPDKGLIKGSVGTVVQVYTPKAVEVEFVGNDGRTYALLTLDVDQLLQLHLDPVAAA